MKTLKKVLIEPIFVEFIPDKLEFGKLYISEKTRSTNHLCLCGCGSEIVLPITKEGWELVKFPDGKITMSPSVGKMGRKCNTHYIIVKNVANFV